MSIHRRFISGAFGLALAGPLAAQRTPPAPSPQRVTFNDAVAIALRQNVGVRQAQNAAALSDASVSSAKEQFLPDLRLNVSGSNNIGRNFSQTEGTIINQSTQSASTGVSSSVTLFDGFKTVASLHSAQASEDASSKDLTRAKQTAVFTVASNYVALINQQEQLRVQTENLASQQAQLDQIQRLVDAGVRPISDLYQQKASAASANLAITQARRGVELAKVDLMQTLQLDPAGSYDFAAPATSAVAVKQYNLDSLLARAYSTRPDLNAQSSRVDAAEQDVKAANASKLPTISLTGSYSTAYNSAAALSLSDQLDQRRGGSVGIGISIPIFDRGSASTAEQRAAIAEENARLALAAQKQQVALEIRRAYLDQTSAAEQLDAANAQLAAAQQAAEAALARYQAGAGTLVDVTQARASQVQAASAVATARNNLLLQQTVMSYYAGDMDPAKVRLGD